MVDINDEILEKSSLLIVRYPKTQKKVRLSQYLKQYRIDISSLCLVPNNVLGVVLPEIEKNDGKYEIIKKDFIKKEKPVNNGNNESMIKIIKALESGLGSLKGSEKRTVRSMVLGSLNEDEVKLMMEIVKK